MRTLYNSAVFEGKILFMNNNIKNINYFRNNNEMYDNKGNSVPFLGFIEDRLKISK